MTTATTTTQGIRPTTTAVATTTPAAASSIYAVDCEFINVASKRADGSVDTSTTRRCVVSVGVVDREMEIILYARVRKPRDAVVVDDTFVRTIGGLSSSDGGWSKGIHVITVRALLQNFMNEGGTLVGWSIKNDVEALGLHLGGSEKIIDLAEIFVTPKRNKCQLSEAFRHVCSRQTNAHNAGDDAKMTMELYNVWERGGRKREILVPIRWYCIQWDRFQGNAADRYKLLWTVLRPERLDRQVVLIRDMFEISGGANDTFSMRFRSNADREGYLRKVLDRIGKAPELVLNGPPASSNEGIVVYAFNRVRATLRDVER